MLFVTIQQVASSSHQIVETAEKDQDWWAILILLVIGLILLFLSGKIIPWWIMIGNQINLFLSKSSATVIYDHDGPIKPPNVVAVWIFRIFGALLVFGSLLAAIMIIAE